jgi:hypothetical protein
MGFGLKRADGSRDGAHGDSFNQLPTSLSGRVGDGLPIPGSGAVPPVLTGSRWCPHRQEAPPATDPPGPRPRSPGW